MSLMKQKHPKMPSARTKRGANRLRDASSTIPWKIMVEPLNWLFASVFQSSTMKVFQSSIFRAINWKTKPLRMKKWKKSLMESHEEKKINFHQLAHLNLKKLESHLKTTRKKNSHAQRSCHFHLESRLKSCLGQF